MSRKQTSQLQHIELDLSNTLELVRLLRDFIAGLQDRFDRFESTAMELYVTECRRDLQGHHRREGVTKHQMIMISSEPDVGIKMTG